MSVDGVGGISMSLGFQNFIAIKKPGLDGRLAILWKEEVDLTITNFFDNHINANVVDIDGFKWVLMCFYGWPKTSQCAKSWAYSIIWFPPYGSLALHWRL